MKQLKMILLAAGFMIALIFGLVVVNQTVQVVQLAKGVHPTFGQAVLYGLLLIYIGVIAIPLSIILRWPSALVPPADTQSREYQLFLSRLGKRLEQNPLVSKELGEIKDLATIEAALKSLDKEADQVINSKASTVFVTTAISQSGRLDGLMVLLAQGMMIWRIAKIYYQRPSLRDMLYLYSNVAATVLLVNEIEDLELLEQQLEPVIGTVMGSSLTGMVSGVNTVATVATNAIVQGAANAYLTLRVGVLARKYCASTTKQEKWALRKSASIEAAAMLGGVLNRSTAKVTKAIVNAAKKAAMGTVKSGADYAVQATTDAWHTSKDISASLVGRLKGIAARVKRKNEEMIR